MNQRLGHSITYRIAVGPQAGRKVFTLQTLPVCDPEDPFGNTVGQVAGFSLHAGVAAKTYERKKLERLCRYIARPAVSEKRLSLTPNGNVRYPLKTPYRDGTTHVIFEPLDFIARLANARRTAGLDDLGAAPQAGVQHRHSDLSDLRRHDESHRLYRRSGSDQEDPRSPEEQIRNPRALPVTRKPGAAWRSIRLTPPPRSTPDAIT